MTRPALRCELAEKAVATKGVSIALACRAFGVMACCRFGGHEDKIVTMKLEVGHDETEVQPGVQD